MSLFPKEVLFVIAENVHEKYDSTDYTLLDKSGCIGFYSDQKDIKALMCINRGINSILSTRYFLVPTVTVKDYIDMEHYLKCKKMFYTLPMYLLFHNNYSGVQKFPQKKIMKIGIHFFTVFHFKVALFINADEFSSTNLKLQITCESEINKNEYQKILDTKCKDEIADINNFYYKVIECFTSCYFFEIDIYNDIARDLAKGLFSKEFGELFLRKIFLLEKLVGSRYQILAEILRKKKEGIKAEDICRSFRIKDVQILETLQDIFSCKIKIAKILHIKDKIEKEYKNKPDPFSCARILMVKSCQEFKNILNETMEIVKIEYADAINNDIYLLHELNLLCHKFILNTIGLKEMIPDFYDMQIDSFYNLYDESRYNESFYKKLPIDVLLMFRNKAMYDIDIPHNISGVNENQNNIVSNQTDKLVHKISKQNAYDYIKMINTKKFYESCFSIMMGCSIIGLGILIVSLIILLATGNSFFIC